MAKLAYLCVQLGDLLLVHVGLPVDSALVAELLNRNDEKDSQILITFLLRGPSRSITKLLVV